MQHVGQPGFEQGAAGHVIGIDRQAARGHEQIGPGLLDFPDRFGDARHIVRGNDRAHHVTVELMRLGRDDRDELVLNDALKNFRPGNKDAHFGLAQGQDFEKRLFPKRGKRLSETAAGNIQRNGACPGKARTLAHHRGVLPRGHHDLRQHVETEHPLRIHAEQTFALRDKIDLAFVRGQLVGHAGTGHAAGESFRDVVLVHEIPGVGRILDHSDMETPHLLETADVAYGNTLPGLEFRPLERARLNAGHVMGRCFAHRLLNGHNPRRRRLQYPAGRDIGSLPLTAAADRPVLFGVRFAAHGAQPDGTHMRVPEEAALHGHGLRLADAVPGFFDFTEQPGLILILFGLFLEEPAPDFWESVQLGGIHAHTHALARVLVEQRHRIPAKVVHLHPVVPRTAQRQQLYGIRQALARLHHGLEQRPLGDTGLRHFHHVAADKQARRRITVKVFRKPLKFLKSV